MTNKYPNLRSHTRKRKSGRVVTYYFYDRRQNGEPDIPLGTDYEQAISKWEEIRKGGLASSERLKKRSQPGKATRKPGCRPTRTPKRGLDTSNA